MWRNVLLAWTGGAAVRLKGPEWVRGRPAEFPPFPFGTSWKDSKVSGEHLDSKR